MGWRDPTGSRWEITRWVIQWSWDETRLGLNISSYVQYIPIIHGETIFKLKIFSKLFGFESISGEVWKNQIIFWPSCDTMYGTSEARKCWQWWMRLFIFKEVPESVYDLRSYIMQRKLSEYRVSLFSWYYLNSIGKRSWETLSSEKSGAQRQSNTKKCAHHFEVIFQANDYRLQGCTYGTVHTHTYIYILYMYCVCIYIQYIYTCLYIK